MLFHYSSQIVWIFSFSPKNFCRRGVYICTLSKITCNIFLALGSRSHPTILVRLWAHDSLRYSNFSVITLFTCMQRCCIASVFVQLLYIIWSFLFSIRRHDTMQERFTEKYFFTGFIANLLRRNSARSPCTDKLLMLNWRNEIVK